MSADIPALPALLDELETLRAEVMRLKEKARERVNAAVATCLAAKEKH